jgi:hypothetical protein
VRAGDEALTRALGHAVARLGDLRRRTADRARHGRGSVERGPVRAAAVHSRRAAGARGAGAASRARPGAPPSSWATRWPSRAGAAVWPPPRRAPCSPRPRRRPGDAGDCPQSRLGNGSRRPDSNRGPLHYERSERASWAFGQAGVPLQIGLFGLTPRAGISAGFGGLRGPPVGHAPPGRARRSIGRTRRRSEPRSSGASLRAVARRVLLPLPDRDFDPTEAAVPWRELRDAGHQVVVATGAGAIPACEERPGLVSGGPAFAGETARQPRLVHRSVGTRFFFRAGPCP